MVDTEIYNMIKTSFENLNKDMKIMNDRIDSIQGVKRTEVEPPKVESRYKISDSNVITSNISDVEQMIKIKVEEERNEIIERLAKVLNQFEKVMNQKIDVLKEDLDDTSKQIVNNTNIVKSLKKDVLELEDFILGEEKERQMKEDRTDGYVNIDSFPSKEEGERESIRRGK